MNKHVQPIYALTMPKAECQAKKCKKAEQKATKIFPGTSSI